MRVFVVDLLCLTPFYDRYLVEALQDRGASVELFSISFPYETGYWETTAVRRAPGIVDRVAHMGIAYAPARRGLQIGEYAANWTRLLSAVRRQRPDVVHLQWLPLMERVRVELSGLAILRRMGVPVVYTAHNALPHDAGPSVIPRYRRAYGAVERLIVHTAAERDRLVSGLEVDPARVDVVPHGPLFHDLPPSTRQEGLRLLGLDDAETILCLGILRPYKGIEELLRALHILRRTRPGVRLLLAGQGPRDYLAALSKLAVELDVHRHVVWHDRYIPVAQLPAYHAVADVVALPYRNATQSGVLCAAGAFAAPVVCTRVGGLGEMVRDGVSGLTVPPSDPVVLAEALRRALQAPAEVRADWGQALRAQLMQNASWPRIAERTLAVYSRAMEGQAAGR